MGYKMNGWSGYQNSPIRKEESRKTHSTKEDDPDYTSKDIANIADEKRNTTGNWCVECGAHKSKHQNKDHAFKVGSPPGPDTKPE